MRKACTAAGFFTVRCLLHLISGKRARVTAVHHMVRHEGESSILTTSTGRFATDAGRWQNYITPVIWTFAQNCWILIDNES
jgi:hypothetical protein